MNLKRTFLASFLLHGAICALLSSGIDWSWQKAKLPLVPMEAHLVVKNKNRKKDLLPKKLKEMPPKLEEPIFVKSEPEKVQKPAEVADKVVPIATKLKQDLEKKPTKKPSPSDNIASDYSKTLASLSQSFAKDLAATEEVVEPEGEFQEDSSYFDQIYTLIKGSFVVPPHLDGPKGQNLQAVLRIFLATDGSLNKLDLEVSSGDEHFDKAVMDGAKRVNNFGAVPIFLQNVLRERGIVVELCPVKCKDR